MPALWVVPEELGEAADSPHAYEACKTASYVLWAFSGRKFHGARTVTERYECPCRNVRPSNVLPYTEGDGLIRNAFFQEGSTGCGCAGTVGGRHTRLRLRGTPVRHVAKVSQGGVDLDPSEYKVVNGSYLQLSGTKDVCGLEVTYTYGVNIPTGGQRAARKMAMELVKGWGGEDCDLPERVTNVSRQGMSFSIMDPQDFLDDGRTGVYEVDLFLRASNPDKARKPARVFSPDLPRAYRVTAGETTQVVTPLDWKIIPGQAATWSVELTGVNGDILLDPDWSPQGQITSWNGATLLEFDSDRFEINGTVLTVNLTAQETGDISGSTALWDLYAISDTDGFTLVHVLNSTIFLTGAS